MRQSSRQKLLKQHQRITHTRKICYFQAVRQQDEHHHHFTLDAYMPLLDMMQQRNK
ncbi:MULTISPECIES: hypothetical protein [Shewanella]|uniref:Uncharacterized protein n=1 Tax=Shewanella fodinae TaxID=552357 RepID=A0A4R2FKD6_9GAMM|nr:MULTISPECIES: hypothetical protein [Shewanella]MDN5368871.1 hypothetical protein [Shewanella sp.]MBO1270444.1 hypothetical protein [Shewanella sp. 4t3-1-2LB]MCD8475737.1 hypothetical protein [Shewanella fodinae]MCL2906561.1 hypothetical protein [Shewanella fodinae]TCN87990.1 hypothetical protein EDC91_104124 [Shewanella fodinae]